MAQAAPSALEQSGELRILRLVGNPDAVRWVAASMEKAGRLVEIFDAGDPNAPQSFTRGPIVWVVRPTHSGILRSVPGSSETGVWAFPCLIVIPPGGLMPTSVPGQSSVESFDIVRDPDDEAIVPMRIDRLLLVHRRRVQVETMLQNLSDIIYTRRFDGTITSINAAGERLFGRRREELLGRKLADLGGSASGPAAEHMQRTNMSVHLQGRTRDRVALVDGDGRHRIFDSEALLLRDSYGQASGVQVILTDITEEHEFKERIQSEAQRNEILASIASAARDSLDEAEVVNAATAALGTRLSAHTVEVWLVNETKTACRVAYQWRVSPATPSLVGVERRLSDSPAFSELVQSSQPWLVPSAVSSEDGAAMDKLLRTIGAESAVGLPIRREGELMGVLGISWAQTRSITEDELVFYGRVADHLALALRAARLHQHLQEQLRELAVEQHRREEAARDRSRLTAMLVHDLKNPLSAVTAALELTRDKAKRAGDERLARMLDGSLASARGLQGLIEDALFVYRPEDAPNPEKKPVSPAEVLAQPLEETRWLARARKVTIEADVPRDLPQIPLDAPRFKRAVANLVGNAVKFSPAESTVQVSAGVFDLPEGRQFFVRVSDQGPGVPPALRGRIATPYLRLPGSEEIPGTGLGLTVVQRVAHAHGGRVEIGSNQGTGSVFTLWIPATKPEGKPPARPL